MTASKRKGTAAETALVKYLREKGFGQAERRALAGNHDKGDIAGAGQLTWEVKNHGTYKLAEWLTELEIEKENNGTEHGVVVAKPRGIGMDSVGSWYAILPVNDFVELARDAGHGDERTTA